MKIRLVVALFIVLTILALKAPDYRQLSEPPQAKEASPHFSLGVKEEVVRKAERGQVIVMKRIVREDSKKETPKEVVIASGETKEKKQVRKQSNATVQSIEPTKTKKVSTQWSESQVRSTLEASCDKYGVSGAEKEWVVNAGVRIAYRESRYNTQAKNKSSSATGLFQFLKAWGSEADRLDPYWSCNRFVKVYVSGGQKKIKQHWKATYGR